MGDVLSRGSTRAVLEYHLNVHVISLSVVTVALWITGFTEYAGIAVLAILLLIVLQSVWDVYVGLFA